MNAGLYLLAYLLLCAYWALMIFAWKKARAPRSTLVARIAPYRGGYFPRTPAASTPDDRAELAEWFGVEHSDDILPLLKRIADEMGLADEQAKTADVVPLHPGYSVKVS